MLKSTQHFEGSQRCLECVPGLYRRGAPTAGDLAPAAGDFKPPDSSHFLGKYAPHIVVSYLLMGATVFWL